MNDEIMVFVLLTEYCLSVFVWIVQLSLTALYHSKYMTLTCCHQITLLSVYVFMLEEVSTRDISLLCMMSRSRVFHVNKTTLMHIMLPGFNSTTAFNKTYSSTLSARLDSFLAISSSEVHSSNGIPNCSTSSLDTYMWHNKTTLVNKHSRMNCRKSRDKINHFTSYLLPHYRVKSECSTVQQRQTLILV